VATTEPAFQRARRPEHKAQRYESILDAARVLGLRDGVRSVTLTDIAHQVGIHKSAVLRYFETREEIYLRLTADGWQDWAAAVRTELAAGAAGPEALAAALTSTLAQRPLFCELLAHAALHLERNVSADSVRDFKLTGLAAVDELRATTVATVPGLGAGGGADLVAGVAALAAALWQTAHPPETLAALYRQDPRLAHASDFADQLHHLAHALILGLIDVEAVRR
jgi:AcrR family transcriptional regulator